MNITEIILIAFLVWQISAMPLPSWIASAFFGVDNEEFNSGIDWAENKFVSVNQAWGYLVFVLEFIKGFLAISLLSFVNQEAIIVFGIPYEYILALIIILGHTFPIYNEFNRTRSFGAYFGVFVGLWVVPAIIATALFVLLWLFFKKVKLSSMFLSLGILLIITFMQLDVNAFAIAATLSLSLVVSNFQHKVEVVKA
jgi:glycerol-3-phosphate acyltransferase PlsY